MFKVLVKNTISGAVEMSNKFDTHKAAIQYLFDTELRLGDQYTYEIIQEVEEINTFKVLVNKVSTCEEVMTNKFETYKKAFRWALDTEIRLGDNYTFEIIEI